MKNKFYLLMSLLVLVTTITISCQKEGPTGPQGEQGIQGIPGSVDILTYTTNFYSSDWSFLGTTGTTDARWVANYYNSSITSNIYNSGTVLVYYKSASDHWVSLPQTFYSNSYSYTITYGYDHGSVFLARYDSDLNPVNPDYLECKIVIIPGSGKKEWDVNLNDYEAVKKYFNLKD